MEQQAYGYIRVSTREQNTDRQEIALAEVGLNVQNIYTDKQCRPRDISQVDKTGKVIFGGSLFFLILLKKLEF